MRLILHPGFHKTGTSTVQATLRQNRATLRTHLKVLLRPDMAATCEAARIYSRSRDALDLALFRYEVAQLGDSWDPNDPRPVLMASEDLSGHMPGRYGLKDYSATPELMKTLVTTLGEIHPELTTTLFFSTRAPGPWLASCHAQHLRASRMTQSADEYAESHRQSGDLNRIIDRIAAKTAPGMVYRCALEDSRSRPLGPLDPLLDLIDLPQSVRVGLHAVPPTNTALPPDCAAQLLALNRSTSDDKSVHIAKQALIRGLW
ncbi:MAG: hypothetical protein COC12_01505 [Rhodobacteraceae bacterium]|nr:MAG: hypothetical protein COC12_01505 [Paracoccaceae bacterium]